MVYFIVNPAAGSGKGKQAVPVIDRLMRESGAAYMFLYTEGPGDTARIAAQIDYGAAKSIVCVGGDGTVQEYVGLAVNRDVSFGIIPAGSGNDLLYSMPDGGKKFRTYEERIAFYTEKIINGGTMATDAVAVNGDSYFYNIGGTGIDIQVLKDALPLKKFFGGAAYFLSLIKNAVTYRAAEMTLTVDGVAETGIFLLLAVCNGSYYGGHLRIAPPAAVDDGLLTLCKVRKMPRLKLMALFPMVKPGRHTGFKQVSFVNCSSATLEFDGTATINLDGNLVEMESPLTFEALKGAVRFIV